MREDAGLTQEDFAQIVGVARATVQNWESGRTRPHRRMLDGIRAAIPGAGREQSSSRYNEEVRQELHTALNVVLDNAKETVVEDISARLTKAAGWYGDPPDRHDTQTATVREKVKKKRSPSHA